MPHIRWWTFFIAGNFPRINLTSVAANFPRFNLNTKAANFPRINFTSIAVSFHIYNGPSTSSELIQGMIRQNICVVGFAIDEFFFLVLPK